MKALKCVKCRRRLKPNEPRIRVIIGGMEHKKGIYCFECYLKNEGSRK